MDQAKLLLVIGFHSLLGLYYLLPGHSRFMAYDIDKTVFIAGIEYRVEEVKGFPTRGWGTDSPSPNGGMKVKVRATNRRNRVLTMGQVLVAGERLRESYDLRREYPMLEPGESKVVDLWFSSNTPPGRKKLSITPQKISVYGRGSDGSWEVSSHSISHYRRRWIDVGSGF